MTKRIIISALLIMLISFPACTRDINSELIEAAENGQTERVKSLLDAGEDVNGKDNDGMTALLVAADQIHWETVRVLLDAGADANAKNDNDYTALMLAEEQGHTEIAELLKSAGAKE